MGRFVSCGDDDNMNAFIKVIRWGYIGVIRLDDLSVVVMMIGWTIILG